jgi:3-deoxy-manno-octulosonate cytidylyltransferase (CMP-KDO synthetase)
MPCVVVIPARMGSSRFPGKPLAPILGRPMIEHVYHRAAMADGVDAVYIATCDDEIREAAAAFGAGVVMTSDQHERASDRVAEAALSVEADLYVMVQGDEPMLHPDMVTTAIAPFRGPAPPACVNLTARIGTVEEFEDRNTIKVVIGETGDALYFSRQPIPTPSAADLDHTPWFKQVCIIPFTGASLARFAALEQTPLEKAESIDMLRFLENGDAVRMVETHHATHSVDTPEDLALVESLMAGDPLLERYPPLVGGASR